MSPPVQVIAFFAWLVLGAPAVAQPAHTTPRPDSSSGLGIEGLGAILLDEAGLESERGGDSLAAARVTRFAAAVARGYSTVARDPALTNDVLARAITNYFARRAVGEPPAEVTARADDQMLRLSLLQAAQNMRLIQQNDRIIQLLQMIVDRPH